MYIILKQKSVPLIIDATLDMLTGCPVTNKVVIVKIKGPKMIQKFSSLLLALYLSSSRSNFSRSNRKYQSAPLIGGVYILV